MSIVEVTELLTLAQVVDNRRVDEAVILVWHDLLEDVPFDAAREALRMHRRESTAWVTPAHIIAGVDRILQAVEEPVDGYGNRLDPDEAALAAQRRLAAPRGQRALS